MQTSVYSLKVSKFSTLIKERTASIARGSSMNRIFGLLEYCISARNIVNAKNVILVEYLVLGMLGPFRILRRENIASLLFSSLIIFPICSELAMSARNNRSTFSSVSSSLQVKYSRIAFKPFY